MDSRLVVRQRLWVQTIRARRASALLLRPGDEAPAVYAPGSQPIPGAHLDAPSVQALSAAPVVHAQPGASLAPQLDSAPQPFATILAGVRGPRGAPGIPGPAGGSAVQRGAGETLSALRAVYELDNQVFALDYRDAAHIHLLIGITLTSASIGQPLNVQLQGFLEDAGWSWTPGPVWLGADGGLTQTPPLDGFDLQLGAAVSATRLSLTPQDPIDLE